MLRWRRLLCCRCAPLVYWLCCGCGLVPARRGIVRAISCRRRLLPLLCLALHAPDVPRLLLLLGNWLAPLVKLL